MAKTSLPVVSAALARNLIVGLDVMAEAAACDHKTIQNYAKQQLVVRVGHGTYQLVPSCALIIGHLRASAAGRHGKDANIDAARSNAQLKDAQRTYVELRTAKLLGETISLPEVRAAWSEIALNVKQMFLSFPGRVRFTLPHLTGEDQAAIDALVREMLDEVAFCDVQPRLPATSANTIIDHDHEISEQPEEA